MSINETRYSQTFLPIVVLRTKSMDFFENAKI